MQSTARIMILPYQARWPLEFRQIASHLRQGLGPLARRIDHIGSTSVPGLAAKDIIDIQVSVTGLSEPVQAAMQSLGFIQARNIVRDHQPPGAADAESEWEKWFFKPPPGDRRCNIHVRVLGRANQRYPLLFRDYLRDHPATAAAYAELKRRLAESLADPDTYPDVKDPAVDLIYLAAEDWATSTGWGMGESDA